jgi:hypothetical protein
VKNAYRKTRERGRMPLVHVKPPAQSGNATATKLTDDERPVVPGDGRRWKAGDLAERNPRAIRN